ncbi:hypothetical protein PT277_05075 [Acetobacteraceae bacterium ESL0709]|nr:hypothetical protein [Acetobacteraceae bacterium ESL0697]MDF7678067.1 hypothetical protein [Acetobacteraceae bacterium ESL0709]
MKIQDKYGALREVYGITWRSGKTFFYTLEKDGGGFIFIQESSVNIVDNTIPFRTIYCDGSILHWALVENNLKESLQETNPEARKIFRSILEQEGCVYPDFE